MKKLTLSVAEGTRQKASNKNYSLQTEVRSLEALRNAVQYDHVAGTFRNNERSNDNFISADCVMMDCDNSHSDKPDDWLTPEGLSERLPDVEFSVIYSKSHMKEKKGELDKATGERKIYSPRPRWHVYFALSETVAKATLIRELKEKLLVLVSEFDSDAKDAARFFYGVEHPQAELHEGNLYVDEFITIAGIELPEPETKSNTYSNTHAETHTEAIQQERIEEGQRNSTLFHIALDALIKYDEAKARQLFDKACTQCNPPLSVRECTKIWESALKRRNAFREKFTDKKKTLTLQVIEQTLQALNISVQFNVITKELEVSDLPAENAYMPAAYYSMDKNAKKQANTELLPLFLEAYFKDKQFRFGKDFLVHSIAAISNTHRYNPVLDMLQSTKWDGQDRLIQLCSVLGIQDNGYHCMFLRKWLHQAIALACNDDGAISPEFALVFQGAQGVGKTNFFRRLAVRPEWFKEGAVIDMRDKDSRIESTSVWLCELGELDSTLKREQASLKAFLTANFDTYRKPYARKADKAERRTCFCATVNPEAVNRDTTGSRRFVYIHVDALDKCFIYESMTPEWCAQLWRQAYEELYLANGRTGFYLTDDERAYSEKANEEFSVALPVETELLDLLDWDSNPVDWEYRTATEILKMCELHKKYEANKAGEALTRLCKRYSGADKKRSHGRTTYRVPSTRT